MVILGKLRAVHKLLFLSRKSRNFINISDRIKLNNSLKQQK